MGRKGIIQVMLGLFVVSALFALVFNLLYSARFSSFQSFFLQYMYHVLMVPLLLGSSGFLIVDFLLGRGDRRMSFSLVQASRFLGVVLLSVYVLSILLSAMSLSAIADLIGQIFLKARFVFAIIGGLLAVGLGVKSQRAL